MSTRLRYRDGAKLTERDSILVKQVMEHDFGDGRRLSDFDQLVVYSEDDMVIFMYNNKCIAKISVIGTLALPDMQYARMLHHIWDLAAARNPADLKPEAEPRMTSVEDDSRDRWVMVAARTLIHSNSREEILGDILEQRKSDRDYGCREWQVNYNTAEELFYTAIIRVQSVRYVRVVVGLFKNITEWVVKMSKG